MQHVFSVEVEQCKRDFIVAAHGQQHMHLFGDVDMFWEPDRQHYCYTCGHEHYIPKAVDVLASGPSCKNLSKMFTNKADFVGGHLAVTHVAYI